MKSVCRFVDDLPLGDDVAREHARTCAACARSLGLRGAARAAWETSRALDDEETFARRSRRLLARSESAKGRVSLTRLAFAFTLAVAVSAAAGTTVTGLRRLVSNLSALQARGPAASPSPIERAARVERASPAPMASTPSPEPEASSAPAVPEPTSSRSPPAGGRGGVLHVAAPVTAPGDEGPSWRAAEEALARGDRRGAEETLRGLLARDRRSARAALRLAELLLARGEAAEARTWVEPLALDGATEGSEDAAWLYTRCFADARERAKAWGRVREARPPSASRDLAAAEEGSLRVDAGDCDAGRALATELASRPLAPTVSPRLERLRQRIAAVCPAVP